MRLFSQELQKIIASGYTRAIALTAFLVGVVLTVFDGVGFLAEPERAQDATQVANLYTDTVYLAWIFPAVLGILLMTSEFRWGTAVQTFLQTPRRGVVVTWKMLAATLGGLIVALSSLAGAFLAATVILQVVGEPSSPEWGRLIGGSVGLVLVGVVTAPLGVAVGALVRSQLVALGVFIGWVLLVEQVAALVFGPVGVFLPGALIPVAVSLEWTAGDLSGIFADAVTPLSAALYLAVEAALMGAIASYTTLRRDID